MSIQNWISFCLHTVVSSSCSELCGWRCEEHVEHVRKVGTTWPNMPELQRDFASAWASCASLFEPRFDWIIADSNVCLNIKKSWCRSLQMLYNSHNKWLLSIYRCFQYLVLRETNLCVWKGGIGWVGSVGSACTKESASACWNVFRSNQLRRSSFQVFSFSLILLLPLSPETYGFCTILRGIETLLNIPS